MSTKHTYTADGMKVFGSFEKFNRPLYGGHTRDDSQNRFFTLAGDTPVFMGISSDYTRDTWCYQAKNGVLMSGFALTEGYRFPGRKDSYSGWFHDCSDVEATWKHGFMEYTLSRFSPYFPRTGVKIAVYPISGTDGFLVHYDLFTEERLIFCGALGGITPFFGRFEYHESERKEFSIEDCKENSAKIIGKYAEITGPGSVTMSFAADFDCELSVDGAEAMAEKFPSEFLVQHGGAPQVVKFRRELLPGERLSGNVVVLRNGDEKQLQRYLLPEAVTKLKAAIRQKYASIALHSPDEVLNASVPDTVTALDASFHGKSFYHGAIGYHAPFLGWRGWYAPALIGWHDRVKSAILSHFDTITRCEGDEKVWWDGGPRPDLDHEGTQYHHLANSSGHLTALLHRDDIYDMQEVAIDMTLFYLEHTGDLATAGAIYDRLLELLDWEERILDPDGDGLYQNFLNTWISDGHSYDGAGCAQASAYNYWANAEAALVGRKLGRDVSGLEARAKKIFDAMQSKLWLNDAGTMAESLDTIGNKLIHPSPELSTIYLAIDCHTVDMMQAHRMLRWSERNIPAEKTLNRQGRFSFSANWLPKKYSTYGLFPAENACLALAYYRIGEAERAFEIVNALADVFALSPNLGSICHVAAASGALDDGDVDFTDVSSCYLRMLIEGMWGVRFRRMEDRIEVAPQIPESWSEASLTLPELSIAYRREKGKTVLSASFADDTTLKQFRLPLHSAEIEQLFVNGSAASFRIVAGFGRPFIEFDGGSSGRIEAELYESEVPLPQLKCTEIAAYSGNLVRIEVENGSFDGISFPADTVETVEQGSAHCVVRVTGERAKMIDGFLFSGDTILPVTIALKTVEKPAETLILTKPETIDLANYFNASLKTIHEREFRSPRPQGYSIGQRLNGRYAWEWNQFGHNALNVDDSLLRSCGGKIITRSKLEFITPAAGDNALCVSLWENFPTSAEIPLSGSASAVAVLLAGTTNAMQSYVVNGTLEVVYADGGTEKAELIEPINFDDFLLPPFQRGCEVVNFGNGTHGEAVVLHLDAKRELKALRVTAVANEVIVDLLGITLYR